MKDTKLKLIIYKLELVLLNFIMLQRRYFHQIKLYWFELKEAYSTSELLEQVILIGITLFLLLSAIGLAISGVILH